MYKYQKLVKMIAGKTCYFTQIPQYYWSMGELGKNIKKTNIKNDICLHSEIPSEMMEFFYNIERLKKMKSSDYKKYRIERVYNILQCITHYPKMEELIDCNHLYYKTANFF